ncbi:hypothetical protein HDU96_003117 [Phlyctochytrium bullatum]|nr:hypothetical protein HDU96_003117 [Phlyctochytrium bullatum]
MALQASPVVSSISVTNEVSLTALTDSSTTSASIIPAVTATSRRSTSISSTSSMASTSTTTTAATALSPVSTYDVPVQQTGDGSPTIGGFPLWSLVLMGVCLLLAAALFGLAIYLCRRGPKERRKHEAKLEPNTMPPSPPDEGDSTFFGVGGPSRPRHSFPHADAQSSVMASLGVSSPSLPRPPGSHPTSPFNSPPTAIPPNVLEATGYIVSRNARGPGYAPGAPPSSTDTTETVSSLAHRMGPSDLIQGFRNRIAADSSIRSATPPPSISSTEAHLGPQYAGGELPSEEIEMEAMDLPPPGSVSSSGYRLSETETSSSIAQPDRGFVSNATSSPRLQDGTSRRGWWTQAVPGTARRQQQPLQPPQESGMQNSKSNPRRSSSVGGFSSVVSVLSGSDGALDRTSGERGRLDGEKAVSNAELPSPVLRGPPVPGPSRDFDEAFGSESKKDILAGLGASVTAYLDALEATSSSSSSQPASRPPPPSAASSSSSSSDRKRNARHSTGNMSSSGFSSSTMTATTAVSDPASTDIDSLLHTSSSSSQSSTRPPLPPSPESHATASSVMSLETPFDRNAYTFAVDPEIVAGVFFDKVPVATPSPPPTTTRRSLPMEMERELMMVRSASVASKNSMTVENGAEDEDGSGDEESVSDTSVSRVPPGPRKPSLGSTAKPGKPALRKPSVTFAADTKAGHDYDDEDGEGDTSEFPEFDAQLSDIASTATDMGAEESEDGLGTTEPLGGDDDLIANIADLGPSPEATPWRTEPPAIPEPPEVHSNAASPPKLPEPDTTTWAISTAEAATPQSIASIGGKGSAGSLAEVSSAPMTPPKTGNPASSRRPSDATTPGSRGVASWFSRSKGSAASTPTSEAPSVGAVSSTQSTPPGAERLMAGGASQQSSTARSALGFLGKIFGRDTTSPRRQTLESVPYKPDAETGEALPDDASPSRTEGDQPAAAATPQSVSTPASAAARDSSSLDRATIISPSPNPAASVSTTAPSTPASDRTITRNTPGASVRSGKSPGLEVEEGPLESSLLAILAEKKLQQQREAGAKTVEAGEGEPDRTERQTSFFFQSTISPLEKATTGAEQEQKTDGLPAQLPVEITVIVEGASAGEPILSPKSLEGSEQTTDDEDSSASEATSGWARGPPGRSPGSVRPIRSGSTGSAGVAEQAPASSNPVVPSPSEATLNGGSTGQSHRSNAMVDSFSPAPSMTSSLANASVTANASPFFSEASGPNASARASTGSSVDIRALLNRLETSVVHQDGSAPNTAHSSVVSKENSAVSLSASQSTTGGLSSIVGPGPSPISSSSIHTPSMSPRSKRSSRVLAMAADFESGRASQTATPQSIRRINASEEVQRLKSLQPRSSAANAAKSKDGSAAGASVSADTTTSVGVDATVAQRESTVQKVVEKLTTQLSSSSIASDKARSVVTATVPLDAKGMQRMSLSDKGGLSSDSPRNSVVAAAKERLAQKSKSTEELSSASGVDFSSATVSANAADQASGRKPRESTSSLVSKAVERFSTIGASETTSSIKTSPQPSSTAIKAAAATMESLAKRSATISQSGTHRSKEDLVAQTRVAVSAALFSQGQPPALATPSEKLIQQVESILVAPDPLSLIAQETIPASADSPSTQKRVSVGARGIRMTDEDDDTKSEISVSTVSSIISTPAITAPSDRPRTAPTIGVGSIRQSWEKRTSIGPGSRPGGEGSGGSSPNTSPIPERHSLIRERKSFSSVAARISEGNTAGGRTLSKAASAESIPTPPRDAVSGPSSAQASPVPPRRVESLPTSPVPPPRTAASKVASMVASLEAPAAKDEDEEDNGKDVPSTPRSARRRRTKTGGSIGELPISPKLSRNASPRPSRPLSMVSIGSVTDDGKAGDINSGMGDHRPRSSQAASPNLAASTGITGSISAVAHTQFTPGWRKEEMALSVGDMVRIVERYEDGWCKGVNLTQGRKVGIFPESCVSGVPNPTTGRSSVSNNEPAAASPSTSATQSTEGRSGGSNRFSGGNWREAMMEVYGGPNGMLAGVKTTVSASGSTAADRTRRSATNLEPAGNGNLAAAGGNGLRKSSSTTFVSALEVFEGGRGAGGSAESITVTAPSSPGGHRVSESAMKKIPITVLTGFLGAGKTTVVLSILKQLPPDYKVVFLKNEFGNVKVDSHLAQRENVVVTEIMNGCLCCVLVGQIENALLEIKENYEVDRVIIETSGSAFPAPIAWQIKKIEHEGFFLDGIVTVVDCENFLGYEDKSYTAKLQAQYTDLILLNKHHLVTEDKLDLVLDRVYDLNEDTPVLRCNSDGGISSEVIFGLDSKLHLLQNESTIDDHHEREVDLIHVQKQVYRLKGYLTLLDENGQILHAVVNMAFGRLTITPSLRPSPDWELVVMGTELHGIAPVIAEKLNLTDEECQFTASHRH